MPEPGLRARLRPRSWRPLLWCALALLALAVGITAYAQEGSGPSGVIDDGLRRIEWQITGIDVGAHAFNGGTSAGPLRAR
jgi:hypothetical protein